MSEPDRRGFRASVAAITGLHANLANAIVDAGIVSLTDLEVAAYDGRLARIPGFGTRRVAQVRDRLDRHLGHAARLQPLYPRPAVSTLLALDAEYRRLVDRIGRRPYGPEHRPMSAEESFEEIAEEVTWMTPRRFNPRNQQWLPVWHTTREGWDITAMYSNTPRAYLAGKRRDWVIIVYERGGEDDHCTVVTEHSGPLRGRRVVRGRENECLAVYQMVGQMTGQTAGQTAGTTNDRNTRRSFRRNRVAPEVRAWVHELAESLPGEASDPRFRKDRYREAAGRDQERARE